MSVGSITELPIYTVLILATSGQIGLCPQLRSSVTSLLTNADRNRPNSELAVRLALNEINKYTAYDNLGTGEGVYVETLDNINAVYNSIIVSGSYLTGYMDGDTIKISGYADSIPITSFTSGSLSVQGGKYQYSNTVEASSIPSTGYTIAYANEDDVLGKIFLKCTTPVEDLMQTYSIGYDGNQQGFVSNFYAPTAEGLLTGWNYGLNLSGEYAWLDQDREIKIYNNGAVPSSGQIGISLFYDKVVWAPDYGYVFTPEIQRVNLNTDTISNRGSSVYTARNFLGAQSYNHYIYNAGGAVAGTVTNAIDRFNTKNDTTDSLDRGNLTVSRTMGDLVKSSTKLYFAGGNNTASTSLTIIDNIQFATDTANAAANANLNQARTNHGGNTDGTTAFWGGGHTIGGAEYSSIEKMAFSTETSVATSTATLGTGRYHCFTWLYGDVIWFAPGRDYTGSGYQNINTVDKLTMSTETVSTVSDFYTVTNDGGPTVQSSSNGYNIPGQNYITGTSSAYNVSVVQKFNFDASTVYASSINMITNAAGYSGASV